jgi:hypothetical protein
MAQRKRIIFSPLYQPSFLWECRWWGRYEENENEENMGDRVSYVICLSFEDAIRFIKQAHDPDPIIKSIKRLRMWEAEYPNAPEPPQL